VVDDLDDGGELVGIWASAEEYDTANLYQSPLAGLDIGVAHYARFVFETGSPRVSIQCRRVVRCM